MSSGFLRALALAAFLCGSLGTAAAQQSGADPAFLKLQALDARIATIGHRLAVGSGDLCAARQWRPGFVALDLSLVDPAFRPAAIRAFGRNAGLGVIALAAGGPAERAGLRVHDMIVGLDGRPPPPASPTAAAPGATDGALAAIDAAFADSRADVEVLRGGERLTVSIQAETGCASRIQAVRRRSRGASADGTNVDVNVALLDYVVDDAELAAVVAHELAHNILRHRARLDAARVARGFMGFGRDARRIRETEIEADRLSVYLMDRAGYDPEAAVRFWRRFGPHPLNFLRSGDHPGWRARVQLLETEIAAIRRARGSGLVPEPPLVGSAGAGS